MLYYFCLFMVDFFNIFGIIYNVMDTKNKKNMEQKDNNQELTFLRDEELEQALKNCKTQEERDQLMSDQLAIRLQSLVLIAIFLFLIFLLFGVVMH